MTEVFYDPDDIWLFQAKPDDHSRYAYGVLDGDTYDFVVDQGFHSRVAVRVRCRVLDTAEIWSHSGQEEYEMAIEQRDFVREWVADAVSIHDGDWPLVIQTSQNTGKYGRWLADVYNRNGEQLAEAVIDEYGPEYYYD